MALFFAAHAAAPLAPQSNALGAPGSAHTDALGDVMERVALTRPNGRRAVIVTMLSGGYAQLTNQLLCSLRRSGLGNHVVVATDNATACASLLPDWQSVCVEQRPDKPSRMHHLALLQQLGYDQSALFNIGTEQFRTVAQQKPLVTLAAHVRGLDVLFTDGDVVFTRNVMDELYQAGDARRSHRGPMVNLVGTNAEVDLMVQDDADWEGGSSCSRDETPEPGARDDASGYLYLNSGFYLLKATPGGTQLLGAWLASIAANRTSGHGDQKHLNRALRAMCDKAAGKPRDVAAGVPELPDDAHFTWTVLDVNTFPNGHFYGAHQLATRMPHAAEATGKAPPGVVHFNYVVGIEGKAARLESEGLVFASESQCVEPIALRAAEEAAQPAAPSVKQLLSRDSSDEELRRRVAAIKAQSESSGMEEDEYLEVMRHVRDRAREATPHRLLVWGLGYDSTAYAELNSASAAARAAGGAAGGVGGRTLFLESDASRVPRADDDVQRLESKTYDISALRSSVASIADFIENPHRADGVAALGASADDVADRCWDTVIVDSPLGLSNMPDAPGRGVPIYTALADHAACVARDPARWQNFTVFVHDCDREGEDVLTRALLGEPVRETGPKKLREFRYGGGARK